MQRQEFHRGDRVEATRSLGFLPRVPAGSRGTVTEAGINPLKVEFDEFSVDMRVMTGPGRKPAITRTVRPDEIIKVPDERLRPV
ncbi:MAG TPA: hypothetical protein VE864_08280 [Streptosporangiaceae bacterium]|nr:hypothetical protein [Streptosporangiaceae bacterium]